MSLIFRYNHTHSALSFLAWLMLHGQPLCNLLHYGLLLYLIFSSECNDPSEDILGTSPSLSSPSPSPSHDDETAEPGNKQAVATGSLDRNVTKVKQEHNLASKSDVNVVYPSGGASGSPKPMPRPHAKVMVVQVRVYIMYCTCTILYMDM